MYVCLSYTLDEFITVLLFPFASVTYSKEKEPKMLPVVFRTNIGIL